jgi:hypothetical protein
MEIAFALFGALLSCNAKAEFWKSECVGRMQIRLPGEADVAGYSMRRLSNEIEVRVGQQQFEFSDGQEAGWSSLAYTGIVYVSNSITVTEYEALDRKVKERLEINRLAATENRRPNGEALIFENVEVASRRGLAWHVSEFYTTFLQIQDHAFFWDVGGGAEKEKRNSRIADTILNGISYRRANEVPTGPGVCMPYIFIRDDGTNHRRVAMTFRLKEHPDVTVVVDDSNSAASSAGNHNYGGGLGRQIDDFWIQFEQSGSVTRVESAWKSPSKRPLKFGETSGMDSFVKITRPGGVIDFGYLALAQMQRGQDEQRLQLHIISEASHAKKRGIAPVSESSFLGMAKQIAASIQHRP